MRVTPSLPQWGWQPKGCIPLPPLLSDFFNQPSDDYRNLGDARAVGAEAQYAGAPKSDCLFLSRDSTG